MGNMTIWKCKLSFNEKQNIQVPKWSSILTAQEQSGGIALWFTCDKNFPIENKVISIYGTGSDIPENPGDYISTVQVDGFVWHVFAE